VVVVGVLVVGLVVVVVGVLVVVLVVDVVGTLVVVDVLVFVVWLVVGGALVVVLLVVPELQPPRIRAMIRMIEIVPTNIQDSLRISFSSLSFWMD